MSAVQSFARTILPTSWFDQMRASSERWMIQCTKCAKEQSVWEAGGIRWKAKSIGKRIAARCSQCNTLVAARVYYRENDNSNPDTADV